MSIEPVHQGRTELVPFTPAGLPSPADLEDSASKEIRIGYIIAIAFFVVGLGWAAFARLDAAAHGEGAVSVAGNRQAVQHRDGGTVQEVVVKEGQSVQAGQVLVKLAAAEVQAQERALTSALIDLKAQRARLEAEINGGPMSRPAEFASLTPEDQILADRAMTLQGRQLAARRGSISASASVLREQASQASAQRGGATAQTQATLEQRRSLEQQLASTRELFEKGYASRNSVRSLERALSQLEGTEADFSSRAESAGTMIAQAREQIVANQRRAIEDSATLLRDTSFQINELEPKRLAAVEQLNRTIIRSPVSGRVVGLNIFSTGGVIQPGQKILDVVPEHAPLVIHAKFRPDDIDGVYEGLEAEVKFLSIHERKLPILLGTIKNVSADTLTDEATRSTYYTAEIVVPDDQMAKLKAIRGADTGLRPGVPVQVMVKLRKRTALQYMLEPVTAAFSRSLHER